MCLNSTGWRLQEFRVLDSVEPVIADTKITAVFSEARVSGSGGCNVYNADVKHCQGSSGSIAISNLTSTLMFCTEPQGVSEQESKYFDFLQAAKTFSCDSNSLKLSDGTPTEERVLMFQPVQVAPATGSATAGSEAGGSPIPCSGVQTHGWYAWNNKMPPKPDDFHIVGEVLVANPGVEVSLVPKVPQGFNPQILLMELHLRQLPGVWPQVITTKQVKYDKILVNSDYESVSVFCGEEIIADIKVDTVH